MITINEEQGLVTYTDANGTHQVGIGTPEGFAIISRAWLRSGWDTKYVYGFSWFGRPIIQLPEDVVRLQELIYTVKPTVVLETGVAHGGSLVFYASLLKAMGQGRVIGVDIEIRPHNRRAIEQHELASSITLIEGSSVDSSVVHQVRELIRSEDRVLLILDSNHTRDHVLAELRAYAPMVSVGSYAVAMDGIMGKVVGAPRTQESWIWDNPSAAALQYANENKNFVIQDPPRSFNEGVIDMPVTYSPGGYLCRVS